MYRIIGVGLDISEQKITEAALHASESRSKNIMERSPLGMHIYKINEVGQLILIGCNSAADEITGIATRKLIGLPIEKAFPSAANTEIPERYKKAALEGVSWKKTDLIYEDDQIKGAYDILAFQIAPGEMAVKFQDITNKKRTEEKLRLSEERYRKIFQNIQDVYFELTPDRIIQEVSPSVSKISSYTREELLGQNIEMLSVDDSIMYNFINELYKKGQLRDADVPLQDKDGRIVYCSVNIALEKDDKGNPLRIIGSLRDITERKQAREKISKLSRAVEQSPATVMITDVKGNIEYVNEKFSQTTGYSKEEAIGQNPRILKSGEQPKEFYTELWETISQGNEWRGEFRNKRKDGSLYWEMASISPIRNAFGEITHYLGIKEDISELKQIQQTLEESELHYRSLYMEAPSGYQSLSHEGYVVEVNPAWVEITGYKPSEAIGKCFDEFLDEPSKKAFGNNFEKLIHNGSTAGNEYDLIRKDGEVVHISLNGRVNYDIDGNFKQTHCIITDITERKNFEKELQIAKEHAEESDRLKSAFLANMSHEIRTPMNAILGFSELLESRELTAQEQKDYISMINAKGNELMLIISDLIDISRIEAGDLKLVKSRFEVNKFIAEIFNQFKESKYAKSKQHIQVRMNIRNDIDPVLNSDKNRLKQVFNNLLSNALKFTQEGFIELGYELMDNKIKFSVKDSGLGIHENNHDLIFERFRQADDSYTRKYGGTGLGLAISKQIVGLLGGNIWVESKKDQGSSFFITLDLDQKGLATSEKELDQQIIRKKRHDFTDKKILIAEDDGSNYLFLESLLRNTGAKLIWAKDGEQALDIFRYTPDLDLIIMDIRMPEKNGLQATEEIRKVNATIPIIALTAFAFSDDKEKSIEAGCNEHLSKPVKSDELKRVMQRYLE